MPNNIMDDSLVGAVEHQIYEAAVISERWPVALSAMSELVRGIGSVLLSARNDGRMFSVASPEAESLWREWTEQEWPKRSVRARRLVANMRQGWFGDLDLVSKSEIEQLPEYTEFLEPRGLRWTAAAAIPVSAGHQAIVGIQRKIEEGPFDPQTIAVLDGLYGHLARATMMSNLLSVKRAQTAIDTLEALGLPAASIAENGSIRLANTAFSQESALWTTRGFNQMVLHDRQAAELFAQALSNAGSARAGCSIALQSKDGSERAVLHLIPVRKAAHDIFDGSAFIALLTTSRARAVAAPSLLRALFDFAPAEADIAADIAAGHSLEVIGAKRKCTQETLRTHLKRIRMKTGCRRQPELVALVSRFQQFEFR